ncbi:MAG: hypothetical protein QOE38_2911 [Thermoleophilaceae bacterium]|nr:hypothetical protein [Thermoleophilaceae bacterium]
MSWVEIFAVFVVSHALGDYLLQTDWQATHKRGGLGRDRKARKALLLHVASYTFGFLPAGIWLASGKHCLGAAGLAILAVGIYVPHMIQDDGRLLSRYITRVKGCGAESQREVFTAVDQSFHLIVLFCTALVVHAGVT